MNWSLIFFAAYLVSRIQANTLFDLAMDFTSVDNTGRLRVCNFVTCWGTENILLMKETSATFRCSIVVKSPETSIAEWYLPGILQLFVVDLSCPGTETLLKEAESLGLFNDHLLWLVINEDMRGSQLYNGSSAMDTLQNLYVTVLSQVHIANRVSEDKFEIMGLYRRDPTARMIYEKLGYWTKKEGVVFTGVRIPSVRRANTEGRVFRASGVITHEDSLNHLDDLVDPQIDNPTKIFYPFWKNIVEGLNGRMEFIVTKTWGEAINGTFNGMLGYIQRNEAEIAISPLFMSDERMKILRFIARGQTLGIKILFLSPPLSYKNNIYLLPFSTDVWYSCIVLFVLSIVLLYLGTRYEDSKLQDERKRKSWSKALTNSWIEIVMLNLSTVLQQDLRVEPKGICGRTIILSLKIVVLFASVFYSASILVLLQSSDRSITTIKDMDESNFKIGSHDAPYNRFYLKVVPDAVVRPIASKIDNKTGFMSPEEGIKKVRDGFFAFNVIRGSGYYVVRHLFNEKEICRLQELDESLMPGGDPLMAVKKNVPYREMITVMFQKILERGIVKREGQRRTAVKPPCEQRHISYVNIGMLDSMGAFEFLMWAFFISFVVLVAELLVFKLKERKMKSSVLQYGYYE